MAFFQVFAARDGDTYNGIIEAIDEETAHADARPRIAKAFGIRFDADDPDFFDGELDGFSIEEAGDSPALILVRQIARMKTTEEADGLTLENDMAMDGLIRRAREIVK